MLTDDQRAQFQEQGFVRLGRVASDSEVASLGSRMDAIMLGETPRDRIWFQLDQSDGSYETLKFGDGSYAGRSPNYRKIEGLEHDPIMGAYVRHPCFRALTAQLIGPNVSVYRAMFMNKPAKGGTVLPYHQDGGTGWGMEPDPFVTVWTALDPATIANGCLQVIPGSHRLGLLSDCGHTITAEQEARFASDDRSVFLEADAGEALLLHNFLLHRSAVNPTPEPRRAFSVCYIDAASRKVVGEPKEFTRVFGASE